MQFEPNKSIRRQRRIALALRSRFSARTAHAAPLLLAKLATAILYLHVATTAAAQDRGWGFAPYRIHALLVIDAGGGLAEQLSDELPRFLTRRVAATIGPAWSFEVELADEILRHAVFTSIAASATPPSEFAKSTPQQSDKLVLLALRATPDGFELTAREFDSLVDRWGTPIRRESRQADMLAEQMFALLWEAVAPLARLELDSSDERRMLIHLRAAELLRARRGVPAPRSTEIYLPILRRTSRSGELVEGGLNVVPWTFVETAEVDDGKVIGRIRSANRRPFSGRRQGRVEQVAIAIRSDPGDTYLRLHSRSNPDKSLAGYQVFEQKEGGEAVLIGSSDDYGKVRIPLGDARVATLIVKHGGHLLARLPVVPGASHELNVPLPDDDIRLAAESRLAALREDLVDVVARRSILMARVRQKIARKDYLAAQELLRALDELPGRSQFNLTITTAARALRSDDPQIQRRIDQLFEATQSVLAQYLDPRPISELHDELASAQK
jgi:hypothetical protein